MWHAKRLSWDSLDRLQIREGEATGVAWSPLDSRWHPVDITTGRATGGSFPDDDDEHRVKLNPWPAIEPAARPIDLPESWRNASPFG